MSNLHAAVVGSGFIGPVHVEALARAGVPVVGILDADPQRSREAAARLRLSRAYQNLEELLEDDQVQAVHVAVPNRFHYDMVKACLAHGKHVLCEKPLAMNRRESAELVQLAAQSKCVAGVNYNIRYYPLCLEAAEQVRGGRVGRLFHVTGSYVQDWLLSDTDFNWRVLATEGGALRAVADIGTHWLDLIRAVTGLEVASVCADLSTVHAVRQQPTGVVETFSGTVSGPAATQGVHVDTEDYGCILLRFHGGAHGCVFVSQVTAGRKNCLRFEIAGANRALAWNSETPNEMWIGHRDQSNQLLARDPALLSERPRRFTSYPGGHSEGFADTFKQCFRDFYQYIEAGDLSAPPTFPTFADGHREVVLCEAILDSHRQQRWIDIQRSTP